SSTSVFRGDLYLARATANCWGTDVGAVRHIARRRPRLVPKRWISVAGTTPASLATSARVSWVGLRRCMTRAVAARMASFDVSRGRGLMFGPGGRATKDQALLNYNGMTVQFWIDTSKCAVFIGPF